MTFGISVTDSVIRQTKNGASWIVTVKYYTILHGEWSDTHVFDSQLDALYWLCSERTYKKFRVIDKDGTIIHPDK